MLINYKCSCHVCGKEFEELRDCRLNNPLGFDDKGRLLRLCSEDAHTPNEIRMAYNKRTGRNLPMLVEVNGIWYEPDQVESIRKIATIHIH